MPARRYTRYGEHGDTGTHEEFLRSIGMGSQFLLLMREMEAGREKMIRRYRFVKPGKEGTRHPDDYNLPLNLWDKTPWTR